MMCRRDTEASAMQATPVPASTPPRGVGPASPPSKGSEPAPEAAEQARTLLNYAWKHVFELPGLPSTLRLDILLSAPAEAANWPH